MNIDEATELYIKLRDRVKEIKDKHSLELKPYRDKMERIENAMLAYLDKMGQTSAPTHHGTPYISETLKTKVVDRDAFFAFIVEEGAFQFLESKANVNAVKEYLEQEEDNPPGVTHEYHRKVNFRS